MQMSTMTSSSDFIERHAVDVSGRLGSLYDATTDQFVDKGSDPAASRTIAPPASICRVIEGITPVSRTDCLQWLGFDCAMQASILLGMVKTTGVSCLVTHDQTINKNTFFLYYTYRNKEEKLALIEGERVNIIPPPSIPTAATHMVRQIVWGFEILCIIPIPEHQSAAQVDSLLQGIATRLANGGGTFTFTSDEEQQITQLTSSTVYGSETCIDNPTTPLLTVLRGIKQWQRHENFHHPLKYRMYSFRWLYNNKQFPALFTNCPSAHSDMEKLESFIAPLSGFENYYLHLFKTLPKSFSSEALNQMLDDITQRFHTWSSAHERLRDNLRKQLIDTRRGLHDGVMFENVIADEQYSILRCTEVKTFTEKIKKLSRKSALLEQLNKDNVRYINVLDLRDHAQRPTTLMQVEKALRHILFSVNHQVMVMFSSDQLKSECEREWKSFYERFVLQRQQATQKPALVYVDFTESQVNLEELTTVPLPMCPATPSPAHHSPDPPVPSSCSPPMPRSPKQSNSSTVTEINVLLLGESGVGNSTFINAFVNYLFFDSLQQAEQSEPIVLIPVSFVVTVGDQFDEVNVEFGEIDTNEDHAHQGQSVTQQCKSYLIQINDNLRLRFIDTPGMGDTRGAEQDDRNILRILTYINHLSHLNAVCLLLKPNASRLNIFFRSVVHQLLTYLTPVGYQNIIFCFTNARSTFFAPGDTGPLLRRTFEQERLHDVPFVKENTFCFDSESFRYLAARRCRVDFDAFQVEECLRSWVKSVSESRRLLRFIKTRKPYPLDEWQSPRKCMLEISMLARPLMETLRLMLYNWKLRGIGILNKQMRLQSNPNTIELCTGCAQANIVDVNPFKIMEYGSGKIKRNKRCGCPAEGRHFLLEYSVRHSWLTEQISCSYQELEKKFDGFLLQCEKLAHFCRQQGLPNHEDPFKPILDRFLDEETSLHENGNELQLNREVREALRSIREVRQRNSQRLINSDERFSLHDVNKIITDLVPMTEIHDQMECIKASRRLRMEANERRVRIPFTRGELFCDTYN